MNRHQVTGLVLVLGCLGGSVLGGLLPGSSENGYQYNRPGGSGGGSFGGGGGGSGRGAGFGGGRPTSSYGTPAFGGNAVFGGADNFGASGGRPSGTYGVPGFGGTGNGNVGYQGGTSGSGSNGYQGNSITGNGYRGVGGNVAGGYNNNNNNDNYNTGRPQPYSFQYEVRDPPTGNDYAQQESSDGNTVRGEYRVLLPDSRTQIVRYTADDASGYNAEVQYEGQAQFPQGGGRGGYQGQGQGGGYQDGSNYPGSFGNNAGNYPGGGSGFGTGGSSPDNQYLPPGGGYGK